MKKHKNSMPIQRDILGEGYNIQQNAHQTISFNKKSPPLELDTLIVDAQTMQVIGYEKKEHSNENN